MKFDAIWRASAAAMALCITASAAALGQTAMPTTPEPVISIAPATVLETDAPFAIRLSLQGAKIMRLVELREAGYLVPRIVNQPAELGTLRFQLTDLADKPVDVSGGTVMKPGRYRVVVTATGASDDEATAMLARLEPLDAFEPNETRDSATLVKLPFTATISLDAEASPDWFRVNPPGPGVLSVHTHGGTGSAPTRYIVFDDTNNIYHQGVDGSDLSARYLFVSGAAVFVKIWSARPAPIDSPARLKQLTINFYPARPGGDIVMGAIGIAANSSEMRQLQAIAAATGMRLLTTTSPSEIHEALRRAIVGAGPNWSLIVALLILALCGLSGLWLQRDRVGLPVGWRTRLKAAQAASERTRLERWSYEIGMRTVELGTAASQRSASLARSAWDAGKAAFAKLRRHVGNKINGK